MEKTKLSKMQIARGAVKMAASHCVSAVVVTLIHQNTTVFTKKQKLQLYVGAYLIGSKVSTDVEEHLMQRIDSWRVTIAEALDQTKNKIEPDTTEQ